MKQKTALILGITGQDGSYLAEFLLQKGYQVIGFGRKNSFINSLNIQAIRDQIQFVVGDLADQASLYQAVQQVKPDEVYNLAAQSKPGESWQLSLETADVSGLGAHRLFDAIRLLKPDCKIYQASSSEMFGITLNYPQNETTAFNPTSPYAAAKVYAHQIAKIYRESYNLFISCGILFNHESPRRSMNFLTQKITYAAACLKKGITHSPLLNEAGEPIVYQGRFSLGNLDAKRDWGYAKDYVEAMWLMLQQDNPDDFVIGTGTLRSVADLCDMAFKTVDLNWQDHVMVDERFIRPIETTITLADPQKARSKLGWKASTPLSVCIDEMISMHLLQHK
ncbi:MAG: GDP-mannose 4,6-dehydratase [Gammaproteobacteria bacterium]